MKNTLQKLNIIMKHFEKLSETAEQERLIARSNFDLPDKYDQGYHSGKAIAYTEAMHEIEILINHIK